MELNMYYYNIYAGSNIDMFYIFALIFILLFVIDRRSEQKNNLVKKGGKMKPIKTKVVHSESKNAWNVIGVTLGDKYKIARVPYVVFDEESWEAASTRNKFEALRNKFEALEHAEFISKCFNEMEKKK
jgi:hypothetical protein